MFGASEPLSNPFAAKSGGFAPKITAADAGSLTTAVVGSKEQTSAGEDADDKNLDNMGTAIASASGSVGSVSGMGPAAVDVKTGEEDEDVLLSMRAKMFRYYVCVCLLFGCVYMYVYMGDCM